MTEQKQLIEFLKPILDDENTLIDSEKIYESVRVVEDYFPFKLLDFQRLPFNK